MYRISVLCFTVAIVSSAALPLTAQLPPSPHSLSSQSSRGCSSGIDEVDLIINDVADESKTEAAMLKLEIARNMMNEGDYKSCAKYVDNAKRALKEARD